MGAISGCQMLVNFCRFIIVWLTNYICVKRWICKTFLGKSAYECSVCFSPFKGFLAT